MIFLVWNWWPVRFITLVLSLFCIAMHVLYLRIVFGYELPKIASWWKRAKNSTLYSYCRCKLLLVSIDPFVDNS